MCRVTCSSRPRRRHRRRSRRTARARSASSSARSSEGDARMTFKNLWAGLAALAALGAASAAAAPARTAIVQAGTLLSVPGEAPQTNATVVIVDGLVREIRPGFADAAALSLPADTPVVDLK